MNASKELDNKLITMIPASSIELFKNLAQYEFEGKFYDLHNEYDFVKLLIADTTLTVAFKALSNDELFVIKFMNVVLTKLEFFNSANVPQLIIDNLYRGRFEKDGELQETVDNGGGYFYLEFDEGQKVEFSATDICVEKEPE